MTRDSACPLMLSIGAFLVGALDPRDRREVQAHVSDCVPCRSELLQLAVLPGLLHRHRLSLDDSRYDGWSPTIEP